MERLFEAGKVKVIPAEGSYPSRPRNRLMEVGT